MPIAQLQCRAQEFDHMAWETDRSTYRDFEHLLTAAQRVLEALLMPRLLELVVRRPAIMDQHARVRSLEDAHGHGAGTVADRVYGSAAGHQRVQPSRAAANAPAGLVEHYLPGPPYGCTESLVGRLQATC